MLMYPKETGKRKRRKHHPPSILHPDDGTCYLCRRLNHDYRIRGNLEEHHVFGGPNRRISEEHGFKIKLCQEHHRTGPEAVHQNIKSMRLLQEEVQRSYEKTHTRKQFMELIGRNYLEETENGQQDF